MLWSKKFKIRKCENLACNGCNANRMATNGESCNVWQVFADHASSVQPIAVPRTLLWSLRRRFVYFSTAVSNLFKGKNMITLALHVTANYFPSSVALRPNTFEVLDFEYRV